MESLNMKAGTKIRVVADSGVECESVRLPSIFEADEGNGLFVINAPQQNGALFPLHMGQAVGITYLTENGIMMFPARVEARFTADSLHFVRLCRTGELLRIQRRLDYRLPFFEPVRIRRLRGEDERVFEGQSADISGGGLRFLHNERLQPEDRLTAMFKLDGEPMRITGRIAVIRFAEDNPRYGFCTGMQFEHGSKAEKERLIRRIFRLQRSRMGRK